MGCHRQCAATGSGRVLQRDDDAIQWRDVGQGQEAIKVNSELALQLLLGIGGMGATILGWRELIYLPRKARQDVLDRLQRPAPSGLDWGEGDSSFQDRVDAIAKDGLDASQLRARVALPDRRLWKAVQHLYGRNRIDVFLLKGKAAAGGPPEVPEGTTTVLPIFVLGTLPPDMRPERSEVEALLSDLRKGG